MERQATERRQQIQRRKKLMKMRTNKVPLTVQSKAGHLVPTISISMMETMSVASFVSVHGDNSHDTLPTSTEAPVSRHCGNTTKRDLSSSEARRSKNETLDFVGWSTGWNCSDGKEKRQLSPSSGLKQQQLKLEVESKRIKIQVEQYQRQKDEEVRRLQEKMHFLELEDELCQCGGKNGRETNDGCEVDVGSEVDDGSKDLELDKNHVAGFESASCFITPMVSKAKARAQFHLTSNPRVWTKQMMITELKSVHSRSKQKKHQGVHYSLLPSRLPVEFTQTFFQTSLFPIGNTEIVNSVNNGNQSEGKVAFSAQCFFQFKFNSNSNWGILLATLQSSQNGLECSGLQSGEIHHPMMRKWVIWRLYWPELRRSQLKYWVILGLCWWLLGVHLRENFGNLISSYPLNYPENSRIQRWNFRIPKI